MLVGFAVLAVAIAVAISIYGIMRIAKRSNTPTVSQQEVVGLWLAKDYAGVAAACDATLDAAPLDSFHLVFKGLSSFYIGLAEIDGERRATMMDMTIFSIRKALIDPKAPLRPEASYVLGKAYYHKGQDYYDEAITYLKEASAAGYTAGDTWEYMALAAQGLGLTDQSIRYFDEAIALKSDSPELKLAAALVNYSAGDQGRAERLALDALESTTDEYLAERCNFMLGDTYRKTGRFDEAIARYEAIKAKNPQSADAWYYQGLVLSDTGDPIKARAAWRKAVSIDPMHPGARQKLLERS